MNGHGLITLLIFLFFLISPAFGQEPLETDGDNRTVNTAASSFAPSTMEITSIFIVIIFAVTILLIVTTAARIHSNTSKILLEKAFERNKELPVELQEPVSVIIKAFPQAEPLGLPRGSLRATVILIFSIAFVFLLFIPIRQINEMMKTLEIILAILIGFYFGNRLTESKMTKPEQAKQEVQKIHAEELQGRKEVITPAEALPEEKREEKKRRGKKLI